MKNTDIIKDKLNILDVVGSYVKLEKAGKTYKGTSPFTNEKTPSFFVSPEKGFFYCFSSQKGGDMFTFIQEIERIEFPDALKLLAEKAGVTLEKVSLEQHDKNTLRFKILDDVTKFYEVHLRKDTKVVEHLLSRGLSKDTMVSFRLGFAHDAWRECYDYLKSKKYSDEDIESVGLIIKKESGGYYDRFRSRIMFPLMDSRSRVVGFSGRIFTDDPDAKGAKYINSPEGPLFDKSKVLYGYHTAKTAMSKEDACILVEGQFDVLMAQQAGYVHTVAISGTGLTDQHVNMIQRFTDNVFLALDSDKAGIKATRRSVLAAYRHGMNVKIIMMPEGMDPADTINHSKEQWDACVLDAKDYIDYRLELFSKQESTFQEKKVLIDTDIFAFVALMKSAMVQDKVLQKIALFLGVGVEAVRADFSQFTPERDDVIETSATSRTPSETVENSKTTQLGRGTIQSDILSLENYINEEGFEINQELADETASMYHKMYGTSLSDDCASLPETERNMQTFILQERYRDMSHIVFKDATFKMVATEYVRYLGIQTKELLAKIRQYESQGDTQKWAAATKQQQQLLTTKDDLERRIKK